MGDIPDGSGFIFKKMEGKIAMALVVGMVCVSFASAGLVDFLSNEVSGVAEVRGPVFYTGASEVLFMNNEPSGSNWNKINDLDESYVKKVWKMDESLEGIDFYKPTIEFVFNVEVDCDFNETVGVGLEFGYVKDGKSRRNIICNTQYLSIGENGTYTVECPSDAIVSENIEDVGVFYYSIEALDDVYQYKIKTKETYVRVMGVHDG